MSVFKIYMASFYTATRFNASPASFHCKLFDTLMVIHIFFFFEKVDYEKNQQTPIKQFLKS